jgi:transcriptional regulator with XRE-family HTH domain
VDRARRRKEMSRFGAYFKELRLKTGLTLREFCLKHGVDPGNMSRLERGLVAPPQSRDKLEEYAKYLGLKKDSTEWHQFADLAAAETGRIPEDVLSDESVVEKLPLLFRRLRGEKIPEEKLDELIRQIRGK